VVGKIHYKTTRERNLPISIFNGGKYMKFLKNDEEKALQKAKKAEDKAKKERERLERIEFERSSELQKLEKHLEDQEQRRATLITMYALDKSTWIRFTNLLLRASQSKAPEAYFHNNVGEYKLDELKKFISEFDSGNHILWMDERIEFTKQKIAELIT